MILFIPNLEKVRISFYIFVFLVGDFPSAVTVLGSKSSSISVKENINDTVTSFWNVVLKYGSVDVTSFTSDQELLPSLSTQTKPFSRKGKVTELRFIVLYRPYLLCSVSSQKLLWFLPGVRSRREISLPHLHPRSFFYDVTNSPSSRRTGPASRLGFRLTESR